jgi:peptide/nickel transport system substrate-binding protein
MRPFDWSWLAINSALLTAALTLGVLAAQAEARPQYGGTLHVSMVAAPSSLDPADGTQPDSFARRSLTLLMFEPLVTIDANGGPRALLATSWQASSGNQRWQFRLRRGVEFHDGTPLTAEVAAASLRAANPTWNVYADADSVVIELSGPDPALLAELALPRNAIAKRDSDTRPSGTGPFYIVDWTPGKKLTLAAEESYWGGRPFLDSIEIEMGRSYHDQMMALELGKADLVEVAPEQLHRVSPGTNRLASSSPLELLALLFNREAASPDDKLLREALAFSVERGSIGSVLLQGAGQPAAGILPNWMSGYGFVFPIDADLSRARHECEQVHSIPKWTIGYDSGDPVARLLAERIALNGKDAGLSLQAASAPTADLQLVRIPLPADPGVALTEVAARAGLPTVNNKASSVEDLYAAEQAALAEQRIIPLFHLPASYAAGATLKNWALRPDGSWNLSNAWLGSGRP